MNNLQEAAYIVCEQVISAQRYFADVTSKSPSVTEVVAKLAQLRGALEKVWVGK